MAVNYIHCQTCARARECRYKEEYLAFALTMPAMHKNDVYTPQMATCGMYIGSYTMESSGEEGNNGQK